MTKTAVVTGASSGIGRAFAERLTREGYRVFAMSRPSAHFQEAQQAWATWPTLKAIEGDITQAEDVARLAAEIATVGHLDLLVNNAGAYFYTDGGFPSIETLVQNLETNMVGQYRVLMALLPFLEWAEQSVVLNVSSGAGAIAAVNSSGPLGYRVSKAALNMLTRSLAMDLRHKNIAIHAVDPGYIKTRLNPDGTGTPEEAVEGMWPLVSLHDLSQSGQFWLHGHVIAW